MLGGKFLKTGNSREVTDGKRSRDRSSKAQQLQQFPRPTVWAGASGRALAEPLLGRRQSGPMWIRGLWGRACPLWLTCQAHAEIVGPSHLTADLKGSFCRDADCLPPVGQLKKSWNETDGREGERTEIRIFRLNNIHCHVT